MGLGATTCGELLEGVAQPFRQPTRTELLELDVDLRLNALWRDAEDIEDWNLESVGTFVRAAYAIGYFDALGEESPGTLARDHGYPIPARSVPD
jgi:hypothetical protein